MAPKLSPKAPGVNGFKHRPRFGVVVLCRDEAHQRAVYERLVKMRLKLKVVAV
jgi:hypothetical protein